MYDTFQISTKQLGIFSIISILLIQRSIAQAGLLTLQKSKFSFRKLSRQENNISSITSLLYEAIKLKPKQAQDKILLGKSLDEDDFFTDPP